MSSDIMQKVAQVNDLLLRGEPDNVSVDDYAGYIGYKPQYVIDACNDVFGIGGWGFDEVSSDITPGDKGLAITQVRVWLQGIESKPVGWGQSRVTKGDIGDARKGAQTDAIKKGLSYFSIGNRAYKGLIVKPEQRNNRSDQNTRQQSTRSQSHQNGASKAVQQKQQSTPVVKEKPVSVSSEQLNRIYGRGKKLGYLFSNINEFSQYITRELALDVPLFPKDMNGEQANDIEARIAACERQSEQAS